MSDEIRLEVTVVIDAKTDAGKAAIARYVDLPPGNDLYTAPGLTREQVLYDLARVHVLTGRDPHLTDGYADLEHGDISVRIDDIQEGY